MTVKIPHTIFIVPYRNRQENKRQFEIFFYHLKIHNKWTDDDVKLFYAHQKDDRPFNRGAMKNIGFIAMTQEYPDHYKDITFVFHDVDTMPDTADLIPYTAEKGQISHYYGYSYSLGGIFAIKGDDFEKIEGFPNFWGWGYEDTLINERAIANNIKVDRSIFFDILDKRILRPFDGFERSMSDREKELCNSGKELIEKFQDIDNLAYKIENNMIQIYSFTTRYEYDEEEFKDVDTRIFIPKKKGSGRSWKMQI
jgi:hypothetical protein